MIPTLSIVLTGDLDPLAQLTYGASLSWGAVAPVGVAEPVQVAGYARHVFERGIAAMYRRKDVYLSEAPPQSGYPFEPGIGKDRSPEGTLPGAVAVPPVPAVADGRPFATFQLDPMPMRYAGIELYARASTPVAARVAVSFADESTLEQDVTLATLFGKYKLMFGTAEISRTPALASIRLLSVPEVQMTIEVGRVSMLLNNYAAPKPVLTA